MSTTDPMNTPNVADANAGVYAAIVNPDANGSAVAAVHGEGATQTAGANEKDGGYTKGRDQLEKRARKCGCACKTTCNCRCSCACRDHCLCASPCDGQCGTRMGRNLVVSVDGTANQFGVYNTNVVELHSRVLTDPSARQDKYYNCGIGTYVPHEDKVSFKYLLQRIHNTIDLAFATSFKDGVLKAYDWLCQTYLPGDKIYLFGFSRGAYQVRTLAGMIRRVGLMNSGHRQLIPFAYEIYLERHKGKATKEADKIAGNFKTAFSRDVRIHFAGLWDTVSSLGLFRGKSLPLTWSAEHICIFRHALALDERRVKFLPEYVASGGSSPSSVGVNKVPTGSPLPNVAAWDVKEVWFPGTHSDIGGGNEPNLELTLSSVPLLWMENEATAAGLRLKPRATGGRWKISELRQDRTHESLKGIWWPLEYLPLKRLTYKDHKEVTRAWHRGCGRVIVPGQRVHVSVAFRTTDYLPPVTFSHETHIEFASLLGRELNLDWTPQLSDEVELDLFDATFMVEAVEKLWDLWAKGGSNQNGADSETDTAAYWIERLGFMARSGQLAVNYLKGSSPEDNARRVDIAIDFFRKLQKVKPDSDTFDVDLATSLERKATLLVRRRLRAEALHTYREAEVIRRGICRSGTMRDKKLLATCLERVFECYYTLGSANSAIPPLEEAANLRRAIVEQSCDRETDILFGVALHNLGIVLGDVGRHEDALRADEEAVALRRKLAQTDPAFIKDLAGSLHSLGIHFSNLERREDALRAEEEAVALRRRLADTDPSFTKDLAASLSNLGSHLHAIARHEDALRAAEEAVCLRRRLADTDPAFTKDLAASLSNLGSHFHAIARHEDASRATEEAVALCRGLAATDPAFTNDLAVSLNSLGLNFTSLERHNDALGADEEAVALRRKLADRDPAITKDLAASLHSLGIDLRNLGRYEDAVHADDESVALRRKLAKTDPAFTKDLAASLNSLGLDFTSLERHNDALGADEEAVALRRKLADRDPAFTKDLAASLHSLGIDLRNLGRYEDAVHADDESVALRRKLAKTDPAFTKDLVVSLNSLGLDFTSLEQHNNAFRASEEIVALRRKLANRDPAFTKDLAASLYNLGIELRNLGRYEDAVHADDESVTLHRKLAETDPAIADDLAGSLNNLGFDLLAVRRHEDALRATQEAVELYRKLAEANPAITKYLTLSLHNTVVAFRGVGRDEDAVRASEEAAELFRKLGDKNPENIANFYHSIAADYRRIGSREVALCAEEGAVKLYRQLVKIQPALIHMLTESLQSLAEDMCSLKREEEAAHIETEVAAMI